MIRALAILVSLGGIAGTASAETFHVTGVTIDHDSRPVGGRTVRASFSYDSCTAGGACTPVAPAMYYVVAGADGRFDITVELPAQPDPYAKHQKLVVDTFGTEASIYRKRTVAWNADPAFWTVDVVLRGAPAHVSPGGGYWARKIGCGEYPVFVVEGFDPQDSMKTGDRSDPRTWLGLLGASPLEGGGNLLDFFTSRNYAVYVLSSGANSGQSIKGPDENPAAGMAYESVFLAKTILDQMHPGKPLVMGGYSAGGLTARAGLTKWCDGSYEGISGGFLAAGCEQLSLWFSGDAPQKGATVPIALQRYLHDDEILSDFTGVSLVQDMLDKPAAQEMLKRSIGDQVCNTNCAGMDALGCESTDSQFTEECAVRDDVHTAFFTWIGGYPTRAGGAVPAVAFSLGQPWRDASGAVPHPDFCWDAAENRGKKFFETIVDCWGNHNLYVDTAGGVDECVPGSVVNSLLQFDGLSGPENGICPVGGWEIDVKFAPSYITTDSALDWDLRDVRWNDYYVADANLPHGGPIPSGAGGFLLSWITEYATGLQDAPPCDGRPAGKLLGARGICRATGGNGAESTQACPLVAEPLKALVATHSYGSGTPGVGVLRTSNFGDASPVYAPKNNGLTGAGLDVHGLELDRFDPDVAYAYTNDGIHVNTRVWGDGTWTRILDKGQFEAAAGRVFPTGWVVLHATPSPTVQGRIHAIVEGRDATDPALEKRYRYYAMVSHNGGASWSAQHVGQSVGSGYASATAGMFSVAPSPTDPAKAWLTTFASKFNGCVAFTSCSTLWRSSDGGTTWVEVLPMRFGYTRTTHVLVPEEGNADNAIGYRFREPVGGSDPTLNASEDGLSTAGWSLNPFTQVGGSWANYARRPNSFYAEPTDRKRLVLLGKNVFLNSADGGHTWVAKTPPGIGNGDILERGTAPWKIAAAASYSYVWNSSLYTTIAYTTDNGKTWQKRNGNLGSVTSANTMSPTAVRIQR